ncbi:12898_t:CDS:1, partial [Racocetra fulgida]
KKILTSIQDLSYKIKKLQQTFYIVDQEGNYIELLIQDSNYHKYLKQVKALFNKLQQQNQNTRIDKIEIESR